MLRLPQAKRETVSTSKDGRHMQCVHCRAAGVRQCLTSRSKAPGSGTRKEASNPACVDAAACTLSSCILQIAHMRHKASQLLGHGPWSSGLVHVGTRLSCKARKRWLHGHLHIISPASVHDTWRSKLLIICINNRTHDTANIQNDLGCC